jgi:polyphosphate glucokinase
MDVLVIDVGGTGVKFRLSTAQEVRRFPSSRDLTPDVLVQTVKEQTADWQYGVIALGYPGPVAGGKPAAEPGNLGGGWVGYDFAAAFDRPVRIANDAVLQALGAYRTGRMLFLGLGTGVGSALVSEHVLVPLELGSLPYRDRRLVDYLGRAAREEHGHDTWQATVTEVTPALRAALAADYVVFGGGNGRKINPLPPDTFRGGPHDAFDGGVRLWEEHVEPLDSEPRRVWRVVR